jgi:hypothetical protein
VNSALDFVERYARGDLTFEEAQRELKAIAAHEDSFIALEVERDVKERAELRGQVYQP